MVQIDHLSADIGSLGLCYFCNITDLILKFAIKSLLNWSPGRFPIRSGMTVGAIRMSLHVAHSTYVSKLNWSQRTLSRG